MTPTLADLARDAAARLRERLTPDQNPALDAEVLARHVLGWDRARWIADARTPAPADFAERYEELLHRRLRFEPVAYITGTKEFYSLDFEVTPDVLVPRPATETVVEQGLALIYSLTAEGGSPVVADVGTGSGCIAIALAVSRPQVRVVASDISPGALTVAKRNAARHGVADRVTFVETSLLDGIGQVDVVLSNPPYVESANRADIMPDVWAYEPQTALYGGPDGLDAVRALIAQVAARMPTPPLVIEFGSAQADAVRAAAREAGLTVRSLDERAWVAVLARDSR